MELMIVRHAIAVDHGDPAYKRDEDRPLTPEGMHKFRLAARGLKEFADKVAASSISFRWITYAALWQEWMESPDLVEHASNLKARYEVCI